MTEQILIFTDTGKQQTFVKEVEAVKDAANALLQTFEEFQEFKRISTLQEFELLCSDPEEYFDETIKGNVTLKMTGGREPDPVVLADLFGIDRENYIRVIKGLPVTEGCKPCQQLKIVRKAGKPALTHSRYGLYKDYLFFEAGAFNLNTEAIADHLEQYKTFANTPAQLSLLRHWQSLVDTLNEHDRMYGMPAATKLAISKGLSLHLTNAFEGSFMLNPEHFKNEILKNK